jgi:ankyrin repeat protein
MFSFIKKLFKPSLLEASKKGDIEAVKQHLAAGTDVNAWDDSGWTPLIHAAEGGHKEVAELLIAAGADVNAKFPGGETPLFFAANWGQKEIAELLIAKGADVNAKMLEVIDHKVFGETPLDMADDKETADLLRKHGGKTKKELEAAGN